MRSFLRQLAPAFAALIVLTVLTGVIYPLAVTAVSQVAFRDKANGSIIEVNGQAIGSRLIGQQFAAPKYFHPRPSAAGAGYDGTSSSGSNLGPTNPDFLKSVAQRVIDYRKENGINADRPVPVDAVTASASGLDPLISIANARLQAQRVASARGLQVEVVLAAVSAHIDDRPLGILGDPGVNVLELNLALDKLG
jgi:K+-transporting ATPase ATPase C chain